MNENKMQNNTIEINALTDLERVGEVKGGVALTIGDEPDVDAGRKLTGVTVK
jgi:hypothetical protein